MVTLHHVTDPLWLKEMRGWENEFVVDYFRDFTKKVVESLGEFVDFWCTINEPNIYLVSGYLFGDYPPGKKVGREIYKAIENFIKAHTVAYHLIHDTQPHAKVGLSHHFRGFTPQKNWSPFDRYATKKISNLFNHTFPHVLHTGTLSLFGKRFSFPEAKGTQDYFGLNYYTRDYVAFSPLNPRNLFVNTQLDPNTEQSTTGFIANEPKVFFEILNWARTLGLPIYITENGIEDKEDKIRPKFMIQHLHEMWRGINFNWPIKGYFHWTLVDNFEWERGWTQRFGLWELDRETQSRSKRTSAYLYEEICKTNSLSSAMVHTYAPELSASLFPG
jgi:beta-glucosidase